MRGWQGFALGFLGLTLLEVTLANQTANKRVGGVLSGVGTFFQKFLNPAVPAFKPIANTSAAGSGTGPGGSSVSAVTLNLSSLPTGANSGPSSSPSSPSSSINLTPTQQASLNSGGSFLG